MGGAIDPIDREVGARLSQRRRALGLRCGDLAGALGVSRQQVINYERGLSRTPVSTLVRAAAQLDTSVAWLAAGAAADAGPVRGPDSRSALRLLNAFAKLESEAARASLLVLARSLAERRGRGLPRSPRRSASASA